LDVIHSQPIAVADGSELKYQYVCHNFTWRLQNTEFCSDVLLIPLSSCDMVLGIQWLSQLGTIQWNFNTLHMEFSWAGKRHVLRGLQGPRVKIMQGIHLPQALKEGFQSCMLQLIPTHERMPEWSCFTLQQNGSSDHIGPLLDQYGDLFTAPMGLPPCRGVFDHRIPLHPGTKPINIRPYRYPLKQKDIIEGLVQEMLDSGIIQPSCSPFASPVVLVGKKDGFWRLCVDYRELNKHTVKDKFPIPVVEELIDELAGSTIFSKVDLRAGYH